MGRKDLTKLGGQKSSSAVLKENLGEIQEMAEEQKKERSNPVINSSSEDETVTEGEKKETINVHQDYLKIISEPLAPSESKDTRLYVNSELVDVLKKIAVANNLNLNQVTHNIISSFINGNKDNIKSDLKKLVNKMLNDI